MHKIQIISISLMLVFCTNNYILKGQTAKPEEVCSNHSCCGSNDPTPASVMMSHIHPKNAWMFSYKIMAMNMDGVISGTKDINKNDVFVNYLMSPDKMQMNMHMFMAMYGVSDKLTVMAMLNHNTTDMNMSIFTASAHHHAGSAASDSSTAHFMTTSGIGDLKLSALYSLINVPTRQLFVNLGMSIPTGKTNIKGASDDVMCPNKTYPYSMQLGSGTFDFSPAINYVSQFGKLTYSAQLSSVVRTGYNSLGYKLGNEANLNAWLAYQWLPFLSSSVMIEGNMSDKISGLDPTLYAFNELSANTSNYGGSRVNLAVGSVIQLKKGLLKNNRLAFDYSLPMYQNLNGIQMKFNHTLTLNWTMAF